MNSKSKAIAVDAGMLKDFLLVIGFSILTAVSAWVEVPLFFTPVPITLQTLMVSLSGALLGARRGALSQAAYLFYGICGLPVFAGGASTIAYLIGPTGGYLLSFPIMAFLTGMLVMKESNLLYNIGAFFLASLPVLLIGTLQLKLYTGQGMATAFSLGFLPFIAGDFIKCTLAAVIHKSWNAYRSR